MMRGFSKIRFKREFLEARLYRLAFSGEPVDQIELNFIIGILNKDIGLNTDIFCYGNTPCEVYRERS